MGVEFCNIFINTYFIKKTTNELSFSKNNSGSKGLISNFSFNYTDILGNIKIINVYQMEKEY